MSSVFVLTPKKCGTFSNLPIDSNNSNLKLDIADKSMGWKALQAEPEFSIRIRTGRFAVPMSVKAIETKVSDGSRIRRQESLQVSPINDAGPVRTFGLGVFERRKGITNVRPEQDRSYRSTSPIKHSIFMKLDSCEHLTAASEYLGMLSTRACSPTHPKDHSDGMSVSEAKKKFKVMRRQSSSPSGNGGCNQASEPVPLNFSVTGESFVKMNQGRAFRILANDHNLLHEQDRKQSSAREIRPKRYSILASNRSDTRRLKTEETSYGSRIGEDEHLKEPEELECGLISFKRNQTVESIIAKNHLWAGQLPTVEKALAKMTNDSQRIKLPKGASSNSKKVFEKTQSTLRKLIKPTTREFDLRNFSIFRK